MSEKDNIEQKKELLTGTEPITEPFLNLVQDNQPPTPPLADSGDSSKNEAKKEKPAKFYPCPRCGDVFDAVVKLGGHMSYHYAEDRKKLVQKNANDLEALERVTKMLESGKKTAVQRSGLTIQLKEPKELKEPNGSQEPFGNGVGKEAYFTGNDGSRGTVISEELPIEFSSIPKQLVVTPKLLLYFDYYLREAQRKNISTGFAEFISDCVESTMRRKGVLIYVKHFKQTTEGEELL